MKREKAMLRSYQPEVNIYEEMQKVMDRNWEKLMEKKSKGENKK